MARFLTQTDMDAIFTVTDEMGLSREAIKVPLLPRGGGKVERLPGGVIRIVMPEAAVAEWLGTLRQQIETL